jgi:hypothetical protein
MLNFYYDPIIGLRYDFLGEMFLLDLNLLPAQEFNLERYIKIFQETGVQFYEPIELIVKITEYRL